jgi:hypothetical protein
LSFFATTNKQQDRIFVLIPKKEKRKIIPFQNEKIKVNITDIKTNDVIVIISSIVKQSEKRLIQIPSKNLIDFKNFIGKDLKITLEKSTS